MRVTDTLLHNSFLFNMNRSKRALHETQVQLATQSKINKPSDSPLGSSRVMRLQTQLGRIGTYNGNISNSLAFIENSISSMEGMQSEIQKVLVDLTSANNATVDDSLDTFASKIDLAISSIMDFANAEFDGRYLFGGTDNSQKPFGYNAAGDAIETKSSSIDGKQNVRISDNIKQKINISGKELFEDTDIFNTLITVRDNLENGIRPTQAEIDKLNNFNDVLLNKMSDAGNITNRLNDTSEMLINQEMQLSLLLSEEKDIDVAEAVMDLQTQQYNLDLSYKISSAILPKSLLDYL